MDEKLTLAIWKLRDLIRRQGWLCPNCSQRLEEARTSDDAIDGAWRTGINGIPEHCCALGRPERTGVGAIDNASGVPAGGWFRRQRVRVLVKLARAAIHLLLGARSLLARLTGGHQ